MARQENAESAMENLTAVFGAVNFMGDLFGEIRERQKIRGGRTAQLGPNDVLLRFIRRNGLKTGSNKK